MCFFCVNKKSKIYHNYKSIIHTNIIYLNIKGCIFNEQCLAWINIMYWNIDPMIGIRRKTADIKITLCSQNVDENYVVYGCEYTWIAFPFLFCRPNRCS